jgi:hypothetical protein
VPEPAIYPAPGVHPSHPERRAALQLLSSQHRYHRKVFLAPPWPEIYVTDAERRHGFEAGLAEYEWLEQVYSALGYEVIMLPKATVPERADFVLAALSDRGIDERLDLQKSRANGRFLPAHPSAGAATNVA